MQILILGGELKCRFTATKNSMRIPLIVLFIWGGSGEGVLYVLKIDRNKKFWSSKVVTKL